MLNRGLRAFQLINISDLPSNRLRGILACARTAGTECPVAPGELCVLRLVGLALSLLDRGVLGGQLLGGRIHLFVGSEMETSIGPDFLLRGLFGYSGRFQILQFLCREPLRADRCRS